MPPSATLDLYRATQRRSLAAMLGVRSLWGRIDPAGDWAAQWSALLPRAVVLVGSAQVGAATDGAASVGASLAQSGFPEQQLARVAPGGFSGWLEDPDTGAVTTLDKALYSPIVRARQGVGAPSTMLAAGRASLEALTQAAVADAARWGSGVQGVATARTVATWYEPAPYCQRCAVLIGKRVKPTTQFVRHPRCDGMVRIMSERDRGELPTVTPEQVTDLNRWQRKALNEGADFNQIVNANTSPRGGRLGGSPLRERGTQTLVGARGKVRLTPKGIYQQAGDDREQALDLLRQHGYLR